MEWVSDMKLIDGFKKVLQEGIVGSLKSDVVFNKEGVAAAEIDQWFLDNHGVKFREVAAIPGLKQMVNVMPIFGCCVKVPFMKEKYMYASNISCVFIRAHELGHLVDDGEFNVLSGNAHRMWSVVTRMVSNKLVSGAIKASPLSGIAALAVLGEEFRASAYAVRCLSELRPDDVGISGVMLSLAWMSYYHTMKKVFFI